MKTSKAAFRDEDDMWVTTDVIEYFGNRWLVGRWLENRLLGIAKPERIIQLDYLQSSEEIPLQLAGQVDLVVLMPIPRSYFSLDTPLPLEAPFIALDHPDITVNLRSEHSATLH